MHDTNYNKMIKKVLGLATSLGKVEYRVGENLVGLYKNQVMFGKIEHDAVYLLNSRNKFNKIDIELLEHEDLFTKQAQKAYSLID
jgi:TfoX/Sxy family transcriptional regulator of competence genes